jgi:hypothetical protein
MSISRHTTKWCWSRGSSPSNCSTARDSGNPQVLTCMTGVHRDVVVIFWISHRLAAVFKQSDESLHDCHGNLVYKTRYNCDKKLKIYSSDGKHIWTSSRPSLITSGNDDNGSGASSQVFGQPPEIPVAVVSNNHTFTILNSSNAAADPILLTSICVRDYFENNYRSNWEFVNKLCAFLFFSPLFLFASVSTIKLVQAIYVALKHYFFKAIMCFLWCFDQRWGRSSN